MISPAHPTGGRIKGAPLRALCGTWANLRGRDEVLAAIAGLPGEYRCAYDPDHGSFGLLPSSWYPAVGSGLLLDNLFRDVPLARQKPLIADLAAGLMETTLRSVHRAVFRVVGSPELMRRRGQLFWNQQFDTGTVVITKRGEKEQLHVYEDWSGHHPHMCQISFQCVPVMFRYMGVAPPIYVEQRSCAADGSSSCSAVVRW